MAWVNKYLIEFQDYGGTDWDIHIQEDGWGGAVTSLTPGAMPARLQYHAEDKHQPIV